jgi:hypothetical protein
LKNDCCRQLPRCVIWCGRPGIITRANLLVHPNLPATGCHVYDNLAIRYRLLSELAFARKPVERFAVWLWT